MTGALRSAQCSRSAGLANTSFKLRSFSSMSNNLTGPTMRTFIFSLTIVAWCSVASAQIPNPSPTPNPATLPPGTQTQPATAPPGTQQNPPQAPPGTNISPMTQPTPITPAGQEPREPIFPNTQ